MSYFFIFLVKLQNKKKTKSKYAINRLHKILLQNNKIRTSYFLSDFTYELHQCKEDVLYQHICLKYKKIIKNYQLIR